MKSHNFKYIVTYAFLLSICTLMLFPATSEGQAVNRLKKGLEKAGEKVQSKVGDAVDQTIDRQAEKQVNKAFGGGAESGGAGAGGGSGSTGTGSSGPGSSGSGLQGTGSRGSGAGFPGAMGLGGPGLDMNAPVEAVYEFDYNVSYYMESVEKNSTTRTRIITYLNSENQNSMVHVQELGNGGSGDIQILTDLKNNVMIMLTEEDGERSSLVFRLEEKEELPEPEYASEPEELDEASQEALSSMFSAMYGFQEIGTRTISGYKTKGYRASDTNGNGDVEFWITNEVVKGYRELMASSGSVPMLAMVSPYATGGGAVIEIVFNDKVDGSKTVMRMEEGTGAVTHRIRMADYPRGM